jgi:hypothetical protein
LRQGREHDAAMRVLKRRIETKVRLSVSLAFLLPRVDAYE